MQEFARIKMPNDAWIDVFFAKTVVMWPASRTLNDWPRSTALREVAVLKENQGVDQGWTAINRTL